MKTSNIVVLILSVFLTACNTLPQKPESQAQPLAVYKMLLEQADENYAKKDYAAALLDYEQLDLGTAEDTHVLFRIGNSNNHLGKPKAAVAAYEKALLIDDKMSKVWHNLAVVYMQQSAKIWQNMSTSIDAKDPLSAIAKYYKKGLIELIKPKKD